MKHILSILSIVIGFSVSAKELSENILMTLHRDNLKPHKTLRYVTQMDMESCEVGGSAPIQIYYINNETNQKIDGVSGGSQEWFGPKNLVVNDSGVSFTFKAVEELEKALGKNVELTLVLLNNESTQGQCQPVVLMKLDGETIKVDHIEMKFEKSFGFPTGLDWGRIDGRKLDDGQPLSICLKGSCKQPKN